MNNNVMVKFREPIISVPGSGISEHGRLLQTEK